MDGLFRLLGAAAGLYVLFALSTGAIYAKSGMWGRTLRRVEDTTGYWSAIGAYVVLAVLLLFIF
jgi:hypothetical protein